MDQSLKLQMDVKNNAEDLRNYMLDLNNWVDEMNKKDKLLSNEKKLDSNIPPPRNKIKRSKPSSENNQSTKPTKISAYDYSAWDKFDVEKACAEIDMEGSSKNIKGESVIQDGNEDTNKGTSNKILDKSNSDLSLIDEAHFEKEMGNSLVKKERWADAIKCYTNAIKLDSKNAIYYANRSLCFLKLKNFKAAETDATTALQLDSKYIKAYQRRAFSRQALGQHVEAKADYEEILKLEPKNSLARLEINKINEKLNKENFLNKPVEKPTFSPKDIFKKKENKANVTQTVKEGNNKVELKNSQSALPKLETSGNESAVIKSDNFNNKLITETKFSSLEKGDGDKNTDTESTELMSDYFKSLPKGCRIVHPVNIPPHRRSKKALRKIDIIDNNKDVGASVEMKASSTNLVDKKDVTVFSKLNECTITADDISTLDIPKNAIQFQKGWIIVRKNPEEAYSYLKKIPGSQLPQIFENSLESDFFSELVRFLASNDVKKDWDMVYDFLLGLSKVKRFSSLVLFMSNDDRANIKKIISQIGEVKSKEEVFELYRLYEF